MIESVEQKITIFLIKHEAGSLRVNPGNNLHKVGNIALDVALKLDIVAGYGRLLVDNNSVLLVSN